MRFTKKLAAKLASIAIAVMVVLWLVFSWFEAEQEIRILCSNFHSGLGREHVIQTLDTGSYLRYRTEAGADDPTMIVDSFFNLRTSRCVIDFEAGQVVSATYE